MSGKGSLWWRPLNRDLRKRGEGPYRLAGKCKGPEVGSCLSFLEKPARVSEQGRTESQRGSQELDHVWL